MFGLGLKCGDKVINNPELPEFLFHMNKESIVSYLRQAFDDDGSVCDGKLSNHKLVNITSNTGSLTNPPISNILIGVKKLLKVVGVPSQKIKSGKTRPKRYQNKNYVSKEWVLTICGLYSILKYKENVNFGLEYKKISLGKIIADLKNSLKMLQRPKGLAEELALKYSIKICKNKGHVDKHLLASKMNSSSYWTSILLKKLEKKKFLCRLSNRRSNQPLRFVICKKF